jgi:predicted nucleic acid-binding protein
VRIVVNDANILIDLVELELLPHFFNLEFEFQTTDLVLDELLDTQLSMLMPYIDQGSLIVEPMTDEDIIEIKLVELSKSTLSPQDCSAFHHARKLNATLLTSDNSLRKFAQENHLDIHGHLWIFDQMIQAQTITGPRAAEKLTELCETINPRLGLPKKECDRRMRQWTS